MITFNQVYQSTKSANHTPILDEHTENKILEWQYNGGDPSVTNFENSHITSQNNTAPNVTFQMSMARIRDASLQITIWHD